jgi:hypothetical protein
VEPENQLADQVAGLANEVEMLRQEQAGRPAPRAALPAAEVAENPPATILVYRDGHRSEIQNYAVLGQTLYVFSGQSTQRVAMGDLDLAATQRSNEERGIDFVAPNPR